MISPFKEVPVQVEAAQQWRNGVGRAHSSRDGSAISSIPLPADAALMTGGLEWRGACRHLRPRQIRTGIGSTAEPGSRLDSGRRPVPVMSVCRLPSCACFPPAPSASSISMPLARKARAHRSSIVRLTRPIRVSTCTACRRRWANGGRWFKVIGPNAAASKDIVCSPRWCWPTGSKGQAQRLSQPVRRHDGWQLAFTGSPAMRLIMATRTDRCRLRLGWETIAARRKGKATVMRYFTTGGWKTAPHLTCSKVWSRTIRLRLRDSVVHARRH